ncbi:hypothetical protein F4805DRAFT_466105 [Annulohypoxylon moriforme]|nr:hypothetical protein F4805DRAFT_466105 [Annulohypoxylon moriforme]
MMLSRPGVSIRRFISQRRVQDEYDDGVAIGADRLGNKAGRKDAGTPKRRPYSKKRPPPPIIVSREQSIHDILDPLPPLPSYETPRSSASSLNSSDRHNDYNLSQSFDSKRSKSPLCSISSKEDHSRESLQLSSATSYGGDDFPPKPPPKGHGRSSESLRRHIDLPGSNFDLTEALSHQSENKAPTSKQRLRQSESLSSISDNIQQLIQEADEAFRTISALTEVRISENNANNANHTINTTSNTYKELPRIPTPDQSPILKPATPVPQSRAQNPPLQVVTSPLQSPRRISTSTTTGVKRKKSKKSKTRSMRPTRKPAAAKSAAKSGPGWALSDNVTELFSGKFFRRVEVDEMLTPSQLEAYRLRRMSIMQSEKSTETLDTESSDTPVEPFHLEDLPSRIQSASVDLDVETPTAERPNPPEFETIVRRDFALEGRNEEQNSNKSAASRTDIGEEPMEYKDAIFPTPPLRHSARFARRSQGTLPSIPESSAVTTPKDDLYSQGLGNSRDLVADSNYVFLQSSPCSMTSPIFRHGPIRLAKCDLMADMKVGADEGLDWTAFQMAISGGAGDWFSESDDTIRRREAEEVQELVEWFDSWNFSRPGGLVKDYEIPSPTSTTSGEDYSDVSYGDIERDNPYSPHHRWQQSQRRMAAESRQLDRDMSGLELDTSKMYSDDQSSYKSCDGRESYASLPQSPMLDLRVIRSPEGDDMDVVPMGYNLGHDLGDFLKWEAEHAYAGDFYS